MSAVHQIPTDIDAGHNVWLDGTLVVPPAPIGVVAFAHGSGSSRFSPRNTFVAQRLQEAQVATLMFDLLTRHEDRDQDHRFNIALLTERLLAASAWLEQRNETKALPLGYFGASTGAAAALRAAARLGPKVAAVVSRGGRPDLAGREPLEALASPTLFIVGANDATVIALNRQAAGHVACEKEILIVPGAGHLFEEPGTLEQVAIHAARWFQRWFS
jgi:pimeloyl-ACP methyl ester carboxylesterase